MSTLDSSKRAKLPDSAFAYVDSKGRRRLPINDEPHVRNALARFNQVVFEDEAARERARKKLLVAARKYGIVIEGPNCLGCTNYVTRVPLTFVEINMSAEIGGYQSDFEDRDPVAPAEPRSESDEE